jgi:hypothetical protein
LAVLLAEARLPDSYTHAASMGYKQQVPVAQLLVLSMAVLPRYVDVLLNLTSSCAFRWIRRWLFDGCWPQPA